MSKIDPSLYLSNQSQDRVPSSELGKDEFLKILMAQIQNQSPMNPMDEGQFVAQMATFSSLEQMMNMSNSIDMLVSNQLVSPVIQYSHMIGEEVTYRTYDEETGKETGTKTSKVVAVSQQEGWAIFHLENGEKVYADAVIEVGNIEEDSSETPEEKEDEE